MKVIAVDDEKYALDNIMVELKKLPHIMETTAFSSASAALAYVRGTPVDIAFLDIEMGGLGGLMLAKYIKEACPACSIVFVTGHSQYAVDAYKMHASGYLMKPVTAEDIQTELDYLAQQPVSLQQKSRIRVQCFGNFEVFVDEKRVVFGRSKSKELLAYLIDRRGAGAKISEIAEIIWEDGVYNRSRQNQMQCFISEMVKTLKSVDANSMIIRNRNSISVDTSRIDCDYYDFLRGDVSAVNAYTGEYMAGYSWAEFTTGFLSKCISL